MLAERWSEKPNRLTDRKRIDQAERGQLGQIRVKNIREENRKIYLLVGLSFRVFKQRNEVNRGRQMKAERKEGKDTREIEWKQSCNGMAEKGRNIQMSRKTDR